jgi:hypothetical protein
MRTEALTLAAALSLLACPGTLENKDAFLTSTGGSGGGCPDVPNEILGARCSGSGCHSGSSPAASLDLVSGNWGPRLVDQPAQTCAGVLADPTDPAGSVLALVLGPDPTCGQRMPLDATPLTDAEIACVEAWIATLSP